MWAQRSGHDSSLLLWLLTATSQYIVLTEWLPAWRGRPSPITHSPQMTVYPEMINGGGGVMICLYCAIEWNRLLSIHLRTKSFEMMNQGSSELCVLFFFDRDLMCFRLLNLNLFTDRFATHQNVTSILSLLRKPGPRQRLQLPQTSGLHTGKQDSTNRWSSLFSDFPHVSIC